MSSLFDLTGAVAIVTGASRGIGRAIAERLAEHGAKVVVSSRNLDACEEVVDAIRKQGGEAFAHACNIGRKEQLRSLVDATLEKWGAVDTLVCNAAVNPYYGPSIGMTDEHYEKIMSSNVRSNFWLCNMVLPHMAERGGGSIIIISSVAGLLGSSTIGVYGVSKAADMALARNICVEWGAKNIRANCIAPGLIRTDFARALWENPETYEKVVRNYPLHRIGEPDEIAGAAVLLAAKSGSFITGQTIVIDGGGMVSRGE
ncbi:MAG TPA: SDR family oxidoreductase [Steroidobacter sp.]|jgi:NAD(P)-dependent dehydrogenase (short-subunit alcohol dehydrogenase family)|nr:SDR family oxidoreductase [Steroidobacteraceae bacterium]HLS81862.1 SDR family oxidoreductase [Steroidobacter sp.]